MLYVHTAIVDVAFYPTSYTPLGEESAAVIHLAAPDADISPNDLSFWLAQRMDRYKLPVAITAGERCKINGKSSNIHCNSISPNTLSRTFLDGRFRLTLKAGPCSIR